MADYFSDDEEIQALLKEIEPCANIEELLKEIDESCHNLAPQDSSPQPPEVLAPEVDEILVVHAPADEVLAVPAVLDQPLAVLAPAPPMDLNPKPLALASSNRVYPYVCLAPNAFSPNPRTSHHLPLPIMPQFLLSSPSNSSKSVHRKKYIHWTMEEHMSFLLGLQKYEEGQWKEISKYFVPSKTPTQIASHAKKYFKRKNAPAKERKRKSIHDTIFEDIDMIVTPHHMQPFNLHNSSPQMDEYRNFNNDHPQDELYLLAQQILEYKKSKFNHNNKDG